MRKLNVSELGRMDVHEFRQSKKLPLTIILDDVRSLYNVGSVFRTSDAFRIERIILCGITATPQNSLVEIHKTALGAEESVEWIYSDDCVKCVKELNDNGICKISLEIPQFGTKHSLNVSVTAGLVIWEFFKQLKDML